MPSALLLTARSLLAIAMAAEADESGGGVAPSAAAASQPAQRRLPAWMLGVPRPEAPGRPTLHVHVCGVSPGTIYL